MHRLVYSSPGTLARASPATGPPFATRGRRDGGWQCRGRRLAAAPATAGGGVTSQSPRPRPRPAGGRQEGRQHVEAKRRLR